MGKNMTPVFCVQEKPRNYELEKDLALASQVDYALRSGTACDLQKVFRGRAVSEYAFVCEDRFMIDLQIPGFPIQSNYMDLSGIVPSSSLQTCPACSELYSCAYGQPNMKKIRPSGIAIAFPVLCWPYSEFQNGIFANLSVIRKAHLFAEMMGINSYFKFTELISNPTWMNTNLIFYPTLHHGQLYQIMDQNDIPRHQFSLTTDLTGKRILLPLSWTQHKNYLAPLSCYFSLKEDWHFFGNEALVKYPGAAVILTNDFDLAVQNQFCQNANLCVLGCFWEEMIPSIHTECLWNHRLSVLTFQTEAPDEYKYNLRCSLQFLSKLAQDGLRADCCVARKKYECSIAECHAIDLLEHPVDRTFLLQEAEQHHIPVPDNIRFDRLGAIEIKCGAEVVPDILGGQGYTVMRLYHGVDQTLFAVHIAAELADGECFGGIWKCSQPVSPALLVSSHAQDRYSRMMQKIEAHFPLYKLPSGTDADAVLNGMIQETEADVLILSLPDEPAKYEKTVSGILSLASEKRIAVMLLLKSRTEKWNVLDENCGISLHVWDERKKEYEFSYIIENRPLIKGESEFVRVIYDKLTASWTSTPVNAAEIAEIPNRVFCSNFEKQPLNQESEFKTILEAR